MANIYGNFGDVATGNYVTIDTDQDITGRKRFLADISAEANTEVVDLVFADANGVDLNVSGNVQGAEGTFDAVFSTEGTFDDINITGILEVDTSITMPDGTVQLSAYTGAGSLSGSYTNSNITINNQGRITAIANGTGGGGGGSHNATTADISTTDSVSALYPLLGQVGSTQTIYADNVTTPFTYVPFTGTLTATTFAGSLNGNASSATTATTAATATNVALTNTTVGTSYFIPYTDADTGSKPLLSGGLAYNRSSNFLTVNCTNASNVIGGTAGQLLYQTGTLPTATAKLAIGTANQILSVSAGLLPTWITPTTPNLTAVLTSGSDAGAKNISNVGTLAVTSTSTFGDQMLLNSTTLDKRQVFSSYYNFYSTLLASPTFTGRMYAQTGEMVFDCKQASGVGRITFYAENNGSVQNPLNIFATEVKMGSSTIPLNMNSSNITGAGTIYASSFVGPLTGNADTATNATTSAACSGNSATATTATTATNATNVAVTIANSGNPYYLTYVDATSGNRSLRAGGIEYNRGANSLNANCLTATNITSGIAGDLLYQSGAGTTAKLAIGTVNQILASTGSAPQWITPAAVTTPTLTQVLVQGNNGGGNAITNVSIVRSGQLTFGAQTANPGDNTTVLYQNPTSFASEIINYATSGGFKLFLRNALGNQESIFNMNTDLITLLKEVTVELNLVVKGDLRLESNTQTVPTDSSRLTQTTNALSLVNNATNGTITLTVQDALNVASSFVITPTSFIPGRVLNMNGNQIANVVTINSAAGGSGGINLTNLSNNTGAITIRNSSTNAAADIFIDTVSGSLGEISIRPGQVAALTFTTSGVGTFAQTPLVPNIALTSYGTSAANTKFVKDLAYAQESIYTLKTTSALGPYNYKFVSMDPETTTFTSVTGPSSGTIFYQTVYLRGGDTYQTIGAWASSANVGIATGSQFAIYAYEQDAGLAAYTNPLPTSTPISAFGASFASPFTVGGNGGYYVIAFRRAGAGVLSLAGTTQIGGFNNTNLSAPPTNSTAGAVAFTNTNATLVNPFTSAPGNNTLSANKFFFYMTL